LNCYRSSNLGAIVNYREKPVGTPPARDATSEALNYNQGFTRDFVVSAVAYLLEGKSQIVRNFLLQTMELQSREKHFDCFRAARGLMPASFEIRNVEGEETIVPDFAEQAIAKVAPVDTPFWWIYLLRLYVKATGEQLHKDKDVQLSLRLILDLALSPRFDMFPTLLVPEWLQQWIPPDGGYFMVNLGPAGMDFRFFTAGNLMAILASLADSGQAEAVAAHPRSASLLLSALQRWGPM